MQQYFLRITSKISGSNKLQKAVLDHFEKYNNVLTGDPKTVKSNLEAIVQQSCRTFHRCTPQKVTSSGDYRTEQINAIFSGGLVTLSVWPVDKELYLHKPTPEPVAAEPVATSEPAPEPTPAPQPAPVYVEASPETVPRVIIYESRQSCQMIGYEYWYKLAPDVQELLQKRAIWRIYRDYEQQIVAEQFGGFTRKAYA